mgnify:CR=1 FL=1
MILLPDEHWQWVYDDQADNLYLDLSAEMQFLTAYKSKQLHADAKLGSEFTLDDTSHYFHLLECISELPFAEVERVQMVLNAVTLMRFMKLSTPQSWHFREFNLMRYAPLLGEVVTLATDYGYADFLVIEPGENASVCMLMSGNLALTEDKVVEAHQAVKVMNNRLIPFCAVNSALMEQTRALQSA